MRTTRTQETAREAARGVAGSAAGTTTKSIPRSTGPSRPLGRHVSSSAVPVAAAADATSTQLSTHAGSAAPSSSSPPSSILQARSHAVSSPMPAEALEYFSETAAKMGGSAASGLVIQSPDGRPAGIFFQPKATPSLPGSKPALSRGVSASSLRRSSQHTPSSREIDLATAPARAVPMLHRETDGRQTVVVAMPRRRALLYCQQCRNRTRRQTRQQKLPDPGRRR